MNKSDLTREIAEKMSISQKESLRFINSFEDVMASELLKDGSICYKVSVLSLPGNRQNVLDVIHVPAFLS